MRLDLSSSSFLKFFLFFAIYGYRWPLLLLLNLIFYCLARDGFYLTSCADDEDDFSKLYSDKFLSSSASSSLFPATFFIFSSPCCQASFSLRLFQRICIAKFLFCTLVKRAFVFSYGIDFLILATALSCFPLGQ